MSDSQEAKRIKRAKIAEDELRSAAGGRMWNADDFEKAANYGLDPAAIFVPGDTFKLSGIQDYKALGFANTSPNPQLGLDQYLGSRSETLQDFQARTNGLPLIFNADGTATFAPDAQKQTFSYEGKAEWWETAVPIAFAAFAGAGLGGFLPGTESVFTASAGATSGVSIAQSAAAGIMEGVGGAAVGSAGLTTAQVIGTATAAGAGAGLLAENSFDSGAMQSVLDRGSSTLTLPTASSIANTFKTAASVAGAVGSIATSAAAIDAATGAKPVLSAPLPSANPLIINLGASDMATKTATAQPAATPAAQTINLQSLLPIAVLVVAVLALGDLGE